MLTIMMFLDTLPSVSAWWKIVLVEHILLGSHKRSPFYLNVLYVPFET